MSSPASEPVRTTPPSQLRRAERRAYLWYVVFALAAAAGLAAIWPKYMARQEGLYLNYEGRERAYEYRADQRRQAIEAAKQTGEEIPRLSRLTWPVILAGASVLIPVLALCLSFAARPSPPPRQKADAK